MNRVIKLLLYLSMVPILVIVVSKLFFYDKTESISSLPGLMFGVFPLFFIILILLILLVIKLIAKKMRGGDKNKNS